MTFDNYKNEFFLILKDLEKQIDNFINILLEAKDNFYNIYLIGNGGSSSTASHFTQDLVKATFKDYHGLRNYKSYPIFRALSLCDNISFITAIANDEGYEYIFIDQLKAQPIQEDDLLISISGSGNSKNIINANEFAIDNNMQTFALTGFDGGKLTKLVDNYIHVKSNNMFLIESAHTFILHYVIEKLKKMRENE